MANAADVLIETLIEWDVDVVFGLPGDGINGIVEALRVRSDRIRFVQARHEQAAAFMACAYSKWTGRIGVCIATSGPGGTNLLTGLYDAKLDQASVVAITGMQFHDLAQTFTQQDVDLVRLFSDVAIFNVHVTDAAHMESVASLACRSARSMRGVAHLSIASDVQELDLEESHRSKRNRAGHTPQGWFEAQRIPHDQDLDRAAGLLNAASRVMILAGRGALEAREELERCAETLAAPVAKALLGKAVLPDDHPHTTGGIGMLGTRASQHAMKHCDALLIVGSSFPYIEYYPRPGQAAGVQIDRNAQRIGLRYPVDVGLAGDAAQTLRLLNARLQRKTDHSFLDDARRRMDEWRALMAHAQKSGDSPLKPARVVKAFGSRMPSDAILVTDSGQNTELAARHIDLGAGNAFGVSGLLASMACALPYAIAASFACPGRPIWAVAGDGGLAMQLAEFSTAVRYRVPLKLLVVRNDVLGMIQWEQMMFLGNPPFGCELQPIDFAQTAQAMGGHGFTIDDPAQVDSVLDAACAIDGPTIIQANVDSHEPLAPPVLAHDYATNFDKALRNAPDGPRIVDNLNSEPLRTLFEPMHRMRKH